MEVVAFKVGGQRYGLEEDHARVLAAKLRDFAAGKYPAEVAQIELAEAWLAGTSPLADEIDQWRAEERTDPIVLERGGRAEAAYAILSRTYSDGWDSQQVGALRDALREYLGLNP